MTGNIGGFVRVIEDGSRGPVRGRENDRKSDGSGEYENTRGSRSNSDVMRVFRPNRSRNTLSYFSSFVSLVWADCSSGWTISAFRPSALAFFIAPIAARLRPL